MNFRIGIFIIGTLLSVSVSAQKISCGCKSIDREAFGINCNKQRLRNGSLLLYQFNCDSIWLTLHNKAGRKLVLYSIPTELRDYHDRVGYVFVQEFQKTVLFRKSCVAPTGCDYLLIDKYDGRTKKEFGDLIDCPGTGKMKEYLVFLDYAPYPKLKLVLYNPDTGKRVELPLRKADFTSNDSENPNNQIESISLKGRILTLKYTPYDKGDGAKIVRFDLAKYGG
jgi:hypothetical protein